MIVLLYLAAVVAANLIVAHFGPVAVLPVAFGFVGFTMVGRDRLHDVWHQRGLGWKMTALVAAGGLISFLLNADALRIAVASSLAFAASEAVNALVYSPMLRRRWPWLVRVNLGNIPNAVVDSALFIGIAFGFLPWLILAQAAVKVAGGALWSVSLRRWFAVAATCFLLMAPPAHGQIVSVGGGVVSTEYGGEWAVDGFLAGPPVLSVRPSAVVSWTGEAAYFAKVSRTLVSSGPAWINADAGVSWLPFRGHRAEPFIGLYFAAPLPLDRVGLHAVVTTEPGDGWGWAMLVKLDLLLWMRK